METDRWDRFFRQAKLQNRDERPNRLLDICPEYGELEKMIHVTVFDEISAELYYDMEREEALFALKK